LLFGAERLIGTRGEAGMIEAERVADQHARIELRRIDAAGAKFCGPGAPAIGHCDAFDCRGI
jgi:hypothetical protein